MRLPLILIAGWGYTGKAMLGLKKALTGYSIEITSTAELWQTQAIALLPRATGFSGLSRYALALGELLKPYGGRAGVIGWSMGGIVALETARKYPELIKRLVIVGGTARFSALNNEFPGVRPAVLRAMALRLRRAPDKVLADYDIQVHAPQAAPPADSSARIREVAQHDREELLHGLDYLQRIDLTDSLDQQNVPTLVAHGREDRIVPWQAGKWLSRQLARGQWRGYEGFGHALPMQAADILAADIRAFVA